MLFANYHFFGLSHRSAFPLGIAVAGLGIILHAIFDAPTAAQAEKNAIKKGEDQ
jgi:hypothetical protein